MKKIQLTAIVCLLHTFLCAQTTNVGELVILPGTQLSSVGAIDNKVTGDIINDGEVIAYSHFNNEGLVDFTTGLTSGLTRFLGSNGFQEISGSSPFHFFDLEFDNNATQPAFRLSNEINLFGEAMFEDGIVDNDNYGGAFIFEDEAIHSNVNDNSHVDGLVRKNGDDYFVYPIGDAGFYRYSAQSDPSLVTDAFSSKYFFSDSNTLYPHFSRAGVITLIDNAEYWRVDKNSGNSDIFLTLSWDEDTTPNPIYAAPYEEIHIVRWDESQNLWVDEGGVADPNTKEVTTVVNPLLGYGIFTLARVKVNNILPCGGRGVVIYNAVSPNDDGVNDYFNIDGIEFCPKNKVEIYNRWGVKVYETNSYNTNDNVFRGYSEGRLTINSGDKLPTGTYFYIISFLDEFGGTQTKKAGYLYINEN